MSTKLLKMEDLYQEIIFEQLKHPHHYGVTVGAQIEVTQTNTSCGDQVTIYIKDDQLTWTGQGCAISQAAMSLLAYEINQKNISLDRIMTLNQKYLLNLVGLTTINLGRVKCLELGLSALRRVAVEFNP